MDISGIVGEELTAVEFVQDYLRLRFSTPLLTFHAWPTLLFEEYSLANGEPEYRNTLCDQIGEEVTKAAFDEGESLTIEFVSGTVIGLSLREEDLDGPEAGAYSATGTDEDQQEF